MVALDQNGRLFSWGNGSNGKLGHNDCKTVDEPQLIEYFCQNNVIISRIECGFDHSVSVCNEGRIYVWGSNRNGKCGIGDVRMKYLKQPHAINQYVLKSEWNEKFHREHIPNILLNGEKNASENSFDLFLKQHENEDVIERISFADITCGYGHNLAIVAGTGCVYSWGQNLCGQLGLNDRNDRCIPTLIDRLASTSPNNLNPAFSNHTKAANGHIAQIKSESPFNAPPPPTKAKISSESESENANLVVSVGCGAFHSCAVTINGHVFSWGDNCDGQLGIGDVEETDSSTPQLVDYLTGIVVTSLV